MAYPRYKTLNLDVSEYYHITTRCVRKAFLCGTDKSTGKSYEHRKDWVQNRLFLLSEVFSIEICSFAVMSNHTHLVLKVNKEEASSMSDVQVLQKWHRLHEGSALTRDFLKTGEYPTNLQNKTLLLQAISEIRNRLFSISWFMKSLNQYIARRANKEDGCTGHFWEGRFFAQIILDDSALILTMLYVDFNPFRAGLVDLPERAIYTSLYRRITALRIGVKLSFLRSFMDSSCQNQKDCLPISSKDYLTLVDFMTRKPNNNKYKSRPTKSPPILERLNLSEESLLEFTGNVEALFPVAIGNENALNRFKEATGRSRLKGAINAMRLYKQCGQKLN